VVFKGLIAAAAAAALATTPVVASAQASAQSTAATTELAPADESVEGSELRGGFIIPFVVIIVIILGILVFIDDEDNELPITP
jgi:glycerol uptake facilitator-like aquaporin